MFWSHKYQYVIQDIYQTMTATLTEWFVHAVVCTYMFNDL